MWIKRYHGLGNIVLLLPVLDRLAAEGRAVAVATRSEWALAFSVLRPGFIWGSEPPEGSVDLDALTLSLQPSEHRTDEFGRLLGVPPPFPAPGIALPEEWTKPFERLRGCLVFAPGAGHPARRCPETLARDLATHLADRRLVLVGESPDPGLPCHADLRGRTHVRELMAVLSVAGAVVCMDSGVLHMAAALGTRVVAIFGGVDPKHRIRPEQRVVALRAALPCHPCNKLEDCSGSYDCLHALSADNVTAALSVAREATGFVEFKARVDRGHLVAPGRG